MARGQGPAGRRGTGETLSRRTLFVRIHDLAQARDVLALERPGGPELALVTAPGLAAFAGVGFCHAIETALGRALVVDCGDGAGLAMAALRTGCRDILFDGPEPIATKLAGMAEPLGGRIRRELAGEVLSLLPEDDPAFAIAAAADADAAGS
jgi:hypothetical protein